MIRVENIVLGNMGTNCYVVALNSGRLPGGEVAASPGRAVVVDPAAEPLRLRELLGRMNVIPEAILLTHGHFDHIMAAKAISDAYDIPVYAAAEEKDILNSSTMNLSLPFTGREVVFDADIYFNPGERLELAGMKISTIGVGGHTKGGVCYYWENEGVLISGDTLFAGSVGRSDFYTGNGSLLIRSIKEKLLTLPKDTVVYPGHGEATTIEYESANNPFLG